MQPPRSYRPRTQAHTESAVADPLVSQIKQISAQGFRQRLPSQLEHCYRLLIERLQAGLDKRNNVDVNRIDTWNMSPDELLSLAQAVEAIHSVYSDVVGSATITSANPDPFQDLK
jgi:hypothetical protein